MRNRCCRFIKTHFKKRNQTTAIPMSSFPQLEPRRACNTRVGSLRSWVLVLLLMLVGLSTGCSRTEPQNVVAPQVAVESQQELIVGTGGVKQAAGDWPLFRGDAQGAGVATTTLPPNDQLEVLWEYEAGGRDPAFKSSPIVVRNQSDQRPTVYIADLDGKIYSFDLETGKKNWEFQAGISIEASPAYKDGHIYIGDLDGGFYCLDEFGEQVWKKDLVAPIMGAANFYRDGVLLGTDDASLYFLDRKDGKQLWKFAASDQIQCSITVSDDVAFVAGCDGHFRLIDLDDGSERGAVPMGSPTGCTPAVSQGYAVVGTEQAEFVCIDLKNVEVKWGFADEDGAAAIRGAAAVKGQQVIFGARNRQLYSVNLDTGKQDWTVTLKGRVDGSPIVVEDRIFVGAGDGRLYVLSLDGKFQWEKQFKGPLNSSPAAAFGKLVIATDRGLVYCLGKKKAPKP